jgi:hypothetical protein
MGFQSGLSRIRDHLRISAQSSCNHRRACSNLPLTTAFRPRKRGVLFAKVAQHAALGPDTVVVSQPASVSFPDAVKNLRISNRPTTCLGYKQGEQQQQLGKSLASDPGIGPKLCLSTLTGTLITWTVDLILFAE